MCEKNENIPLSMSELVRLTETNVHTPNSLSAIHFDFSKDVSFK